MRFKNCSLAYIKEIYKLKIIAVKNKDTETLDYLKNNYPEIFDARFLMDFLKNEIERIRNGLNDDVLFKNNLFTYQ